MLISNNSQKPTASQLSLVRKPHAKKFRRSAVICGALLVFASHVGLAQMTLSSTPNPSTAGNAITVSATNPCGAHAGSVTFSYYWGTSSTSTPSNLIRNGSALFSVTWTPPAPGTYYLYAAITPYPNSFCGAGSSNIVTQVVNGIATTISLASSSNPSPYGNNVTFTATVSPSAATGTVMFYDAGTALGSGIVSSGIASYSTTTLAVGTHAITASYGGDSHYKSSTSSTLTQTVNKAITAVTLASSANPSTFAASVTFTAGVTPSAATGTVQFQNGGVNLGSAVPLSGGTASISTSALAVGASSITAIYSGDSHYSGNSSSTVTQTVNAASSAMTLSSSLNPSIFGNSVSFTATVAPTAATGTVTFQDGGNTLGTVALNGGSASYSTSSLAGGAHTISVAYSGNVDYKASSSTLTQTVLTTVYSFTIPVGYYAPNGNVIGYTDSVMGSWAFTYDSLNRLVQAADSEPGTQYTSYCWGYDAWGNRSLQAASNAAFAVGSPPPAGQSPCQPASGASFSSIWTNILSNNHIAGTNQAPGGVGYDVAGEVTNDGVNAYVYDAEGRLCAVQSQSVPGAPMTGYIYNGAGARVAKGSITVMSCDPTTNGFKSEVDYVIGPGASQLTEMDSNSSGNMVWAHTNVYSGGRLIATYDSSGLHFHLTDWLGTRRVQTNYVGALEMSCTSLPFGDSLSCSGSAHDATEHHFTGKERDAESGLDNFGARYNASSMGRFMTPDPGNLSAIFHMNDPQSWNGYAYARNNPLKYTDPSGLDYTICDGDGKNCSHMDDKTFDSERNKDKGELFQNGSMFHFDKDGNKVMDGTYQWNGPDIPGDPAANLAAMGMIGNGGTAFVGAFAKNMAITAAGGAILAPMAELSAAIAQTARLSMLKPLVTNPELEEIVNELFQVTDKLPGGTAGAVRYESMTGDLLSPAGHAQEAGDIVRQLDTFLKNNAGISTNDQAVAKELIRDLQNALSGH
jgi:RHS repeat-associated protein